ncbi:MAG: DUF58 domain-containing protein [Candidatus Omnitrophica bacterium]|nr:DUF58 domain-containing protein [Candidatus Omnitrophota bacterium]
MIPKEFLKQIRRIQIVTSKMVTDVFSGQYHSAFKGKGIEFSEVREYVVGDDIRSIDWNVTARMYNPYVKKFVEERELTVMLLLDTSNSFYFGTVNNLKRNIGTEICSLLAFSAIKNNDKVGLIIFSKEVEKFLPPKKGLINVLRIIRESLYFTPRYKGTNISNALEYLNKVCRRKTVTFIISDFYDENFERALAISNRRHDLVAITITDPRELFLLNMGLVHLEDRESNSSFILDTSDRYIRENFSKNALEIMDKRKKIFSRLGIDNVDIRCDVPYNRTLFKFFRAREKRLR